MLSGDEYLQQFYSSGGFKPGDFKKMADKMCITAEITVPLNSSSGKVILLKVVDLSPTGILDIMGSICALDSMKDLFKITGFLEKNYGDGGNKWRELSPSFLFADATYNHVTGEISGFGPDYINKYKPAEEESLFKTYLVSPPSSDQFFVRFFVDPSLRETAEKTVGHKLPDEFCKPKNNSSNGDNFADVSINTNFVISGDLSEAAKQILSKPIQFSSNGPFKGPIISQKELRSNNSPYGPAGVQGRLTRVKVPDSYPLYYGSKRVTTIQFHELAADRLEYALNDIANHYGPNIQQIAPGCCIFGGSYNFRKIRKKDGSEGKSWSLHSWATALDFDAGNNGMSTKAPKARLSQPIYQPFIAILAHYGFSSQGKNLNNDWMHFQIGSYKKGVINPS